MIVYREQKRLEETAALVARVEAASAAELPLDLGELEAGVADALSPDCDWESPVSCALREAGILAALGDRAGALARLRACPLPARVSVSKPEGYAYYAVYPELYREAAVRFFEEVRPERAVVIGIRSIGTSLSAAVAGVLRERGCEVDSWTVRPRGHPFDRRLSLAGELEARWRALAGAHFAVVDEGPGLSGSSFACVARKIAKLGIPDDRIVLFPGWVPDGSGFRSESARDQWRRHRKYCVEFAGIPGARDLSAGLWRELFYTEEPGYPAVQPQHERRKYLRDGALWKFAGLGRYGRARLERARRLAGYGFAPAVTGMENGFLITEFISGRPLRENGVSERLLDAMARYLALLQREFPCARPVPYDEIREMIAINSPGAAVPADGAVRDGHTVAVDSRMLPHEWLETAGGFIKTDGIDHHDDHFFPGCQDIAWDLAGACVEFSLGNAAAEYLLARYESLSKDADIRRRLPFYRTAYLSYRYGYVSLAAEALGGTAEGRRFERLRARYRTQLYGR